MMIELSFTSPNHHILTYDQKSCQNLGRRLYSGVHMKLTERILVHVVTPPPPPIWQEGGRTAAPLPLCSDDLSGFTKHAASLADINSLAIHPSSKLPTIRQVKATRDLHENLSINPKCLFYKEEEADSIFPMKKNTNWVKTPCPSQHIPYCMCQNTDVCE